MIRSYTSSYQKPTLWVEILITLFGIAGVLLFLAYYETAFPDASVDVTLSRGQAEQIAARQLQDLGYMLEGYEFALSFSSDSQAAYYLQRTLGVEDYNKRLATEHWPIYFWSARWFKPLQKEEFRVYLAPSGDFLGMHHILPEDRPGAQISQTDAQAIAESFLSQRMGWQPDIWERVEASSQTQPGGRVDHTFAWKSNNFSAGEGELRHSITIQGDQVGHAGHYIKVPEAFTRQYASERNVAGFINNIAYLVIVLGSMMVALVAIGLSRPEASRAVLPALLVAGVSLAAYLNSIPLYKSSYSTTEAYSLFWVNRMIGIAFAVLFSAIQTFILLVGAQSLSRFVWPLQDRILARGQDRWLDFSRSAWRGLMLGGVQLAYVALFYTFAAKLLGWWSPATSEYSDIFATPLPFFYAFNAGLSASIIEELSIRFLGLGFLLWLFGGKHRWLAVLIPALFWAFAHTGYVTSPIYARGVELTVVGLFLGYIFLKFDLLTTIVSHFTYNMVVTGIALLRSSEEYYRISGWVVIFALVLPLLPGIVVLLRRGLRTEPPIVEHLVISLFEDSDLRQLCGLPIKTDWHILSRQGNRTILCLRAGQEIVGVVTGYLDMTMGHIDGIYVAPRWRRQYWGTRLLDAIEEELKTCGASEVRVLVRPNEHRARSFLHNQFWSTGVHVLTRVEKKQSFKASMKNLLSELKKEKPGDYELELPRNLE